MTTFVVRFGVPSELPSTFDGRHFRVPYAVVDRKHFDTPNESAHTARSCVSVKVSGTTLAVLHLDNPSLFKIAFQVAKEHVDQLARTGGDLVKESTVSYAPPGAVPFDIAKIESPEGALMVVDVHRPIGFTGGA